MSAAKKKKAKKVTKKKAAHPDIPPEVQVQLQLQQDMEDLATRNTELRETNEALVSENSRLTYRVEEAEKLAEKLRGKIKDMKPPKLDAKKLEAAVNTVLLALLMDAKGVLQVTMDPDMARVAVKIQQAEISMAPLVLAETMVVQRAKSLAQKKLSGLEIDDDDLIGLYKFAERLL